MSRCPDGRPWVEKFWSKVDVQGPEECWPWKGAVDRHGYGLLSGRPNWYKSRRRLPSASRWMLCSKSGFPINHELHVLHRCDNPICVNPSHLEFGTTQENTKQAVERGRILRGENQPCSKLKQKQVEAIFVDTRKQRVIAAEYGVSRELIGAIRSRRAWGWLFTDEQAKKQIAIRKELFRARAEKNRIEAERIREEKRSRPKVGKKLTIEKARSIRGDRRNIYVVAKEYGIDISLVSRIRNGKSWKEPT